MTEAIAVYQSQRHNGLDHACPHCGSDQLEPNSWYIDDEEVDAWECSSCKAGAPQRVWNKRRYDFAQKVRLMRTLQTGYFRTRDHEVLRHSKAAEKEVDRLLSGFDQDDMFSSEDGQ